MFKISGAVMAFLRALLFCLLVNEAAGFRFLGRVPKTPVSQLAARLEKKTMMLAASQDDDGGGGGATTRRELFSRVAIEGTAVSVMLEALSCNPALADTSTVTTTTAPPRSPRKTAYQITDNSPPQMQPFTARGEKRIVGELASGPAVIIGSHGTPEDRLLEARFLKQAAEKVGGNRGIVVALSAAVANADTQKVLDDFVGKVVKDDAAAEAALLRGGSEGVEWVGGASAASVLPVLRAARTTGGMRVVGVGVSDSVVERVRQRGLEALGGAEARRAYVKESAKFVEGVSLEGFKRYSDLSITDEFKKKTTTTTTTNQQQQQQQKQQQTSKGGGSGGGEVGGGGGEGDVGVGDVTLANFFASCILVDEAIAERSFEAVQSSPGSLLVLLAPIERVRFGFGCQSRLEKLSSDPNIKIPSIVLNPTAEDSVTLTTSLRLTLGNADEFSRPLSNYVLFSSSPPPNLLTRMQNSIS